MTPQEEATLEIIRRYSKRTKIDEALDWLAPERSIFYGFAPRNARVIEFDPKSESLEDLWKRMFGNK